MLYNPRIVRAGISKSFINKKQRWTNSPRPCFDSHSLGFEKLSEQPTVTPFESVLKFLMSIIFCLLQLGMLAIPKKILLHMCLINMCARSCALMQMSLEKTMSARVHICIREYPRFRYSVHACTPVRECMYVTVMFAVGIVLCKRGGRPDDALPLAQCHTG